MVESQRLHRRNHRSAPSTRYQHRFLAHLPRQRTSKRMLQELENLLRVSREQCGTQGIQKRQHKDSVVFGVIYTL